MGICLLIIPLLSACRGPAGFAHRGKPALTISAASNLTPAFEEIGERFEDETSIEVEFNFGASGQLADHLCAWVGRLYFSSARVLDLLGNHAWFDDGHLPPDCVVSGAH